MNQVALGLKVRTGKAALVALSGPAADPRVVGKTMIQVAFTFEEGAVFHAAQELPTAKARAHVERAKTRFTKLAREELSAFVAKIGADIAAVRVAAPAAKRLPPLEKVVKSHPLVHAAEIELYRDVFATASEALGMPPKRVDASAQSVAAALRCTPARITKQLATMGKASGRPWAAEQKEAALAAWLGLARR
jgi:hypothetical protein